MALTFFWNAEAADFSTDNAFASPYTGSCYSASDDTAGLINSGELSATQARAGTYSLRRPASTAGGAQFTTSVNALVQGYGTVNTVGAIAFSIYSSGSVTATVGIDVCRLMHTTTTGNNISIQYAGGTTSAANLRLRVGQNGVGNLDITLSGGALTPDAWFGVVARFDFANDKRRLELYNSAGTLVDSVEDLATDLSNRYPLELNQWLVGAGRSPDAWDTFQDNFFIADTYDEPLQNYLTISSYQDYGASTPKGRMMLMGIG